MRTARLDHADARLLLGALQAAVALPIIAIAANARLAITATAAAATIHAIRLPRSAVAAGALLTVIALLTITRRTDQAARQTIVGPSVSLATPLHVSDPLVGGGQFCLVRSGLRQPTGYSHQGRPTGSLLLLPLGSAGSPKRSHEACDVRPS